MQNNLHTPQRLEGESFSDYKIRRKASKEVTKKNSQIGQGGYRTRKAMRDNIREEGKMKYVSGSFGRGIRNLITANQKEKLKEGN